MLPRGHTTTPMRNANLYDGCLKLCFRRVLTWVHDLIYTGSKNSYIMVLCDSILVTIYNNYVQKHTGKT